MSDVSQIINGDIITFQSLATNDATNYRGQVVGFVTLDVAKGFGDVFAYNAACMSANPNVPSSELLDFMLIKLLERPSVGFGHDKYIIPFAKEWINPATFNIVAVDKAVIMKIYEVDQTNVQNLIDYLRAGTWKVRVESYE